MRLTIVHPCIGRKPGQKYIRTWQMESLPAATLAGLTPKDVEVRFYDDRMEKIPFDEATDLVAISVETYTAKRAYQIATEYRKRRCRSSWADFTPRSARMKSRVTPKPSCAVKPNIWPRVIDDARHGRLEKFYRQIRPPFAGRA